MLYPASKMFLRQFAIVLPQDLTFSRVLSGKTGRPNTSRMKKSARRRKHCALAVLKQKQKNFSQPQSRSQGTGWPKFNQLEMVTTFTYRPSLVKIDQRNFELL